MSQVISEQSSDVIILKPAQTLRTIDETKDAIIQALSASRDVVVDCSQVEDVDIGIVQVLTSARLSADRLGAALRMRAPSAPLRAVLERAGVVATADDPFWNGGTA